MSGLNPVDLYLWMPPAVALLLGAGLGTFLATRGRTQATPDPVAALREERAALMEQLRDLAEEQARMPADVYENRRQALVLEAATLLRRIEAAPPPPKSGRGTGLALGLAAAVALGVAGATGVAHGGLMDLLRDQEAQARTAQAKSPHGGGTPGASSLPTDLASLNKVAHQALLAGDLPTAMAATDKARALSPQDPEMQVHVNALRVAVGMSEKAEAGLQAVITAHPDQTEALLWMGISRLRQGDTAGARTWLDRVIEAAPSSEDAQMAKTVLEDVQQDAP